MSSQTDTHPAEERGKGKEGENEVPTRIWELTDSCIKTCNRILCRADLDLDNWALLLNLVLLHPDSTFILYLTSTMC